MGNPTIYWQPPGALTVQSIDLGRIGLLEVEPARARADASPIGGSMITHDFGGLRYVRLRKERITNAPLIRKLRTLTTYIQSGYPVAFCLDSAKVWGGIPTTTPTSGDTTITVLRNAFSFLAAGAVTASDEITIESQNPEGLREVGYLSGVAGKTLTVSGGVVQSYTEGPVIVRYADLYPYLRVDESQTTGAVLSTDRRLTWDWDCTFVERISEVTTIAQISPQLGGSDIGTLGRLSFGTIQDAIAAQRVNGITAEAFHRASTGILEGYL